MHTEGLRSKRPSARAGMDDVVTSHISADGSAHCERAISGLVAWLLLEVGPAQPWPSGTCPLDARVARRTEGEPHDVGPK